MAGSAPQPVFPLAFASGLLTLVAAGVAAVTAAVVLAAPGGGAWAGALVYAEAVAYGMSLLGLLPLYFMGSQGVDAIPTAVLASTGIRMLGCAGAALLGAAVLELPTSPLLFGLAGMYLPLLGVEVGLAAHYVRQKDRLAGNPRREAVA